MPTATTDLACPPRFATARNYDRPTLGPAVGEVARRLGRDLMPWQQYVADVSLEVDPETGLLVYDEIGLTVPRQSGKSTLVLAKAVHRCSAGKFFGPRQKLVYTAQTRNKAREKWEEDYAADVKASRTFGGKVVPHFGNGNEHLRFPNGSRFGIEATTEKAGHGSTLDEAYIDEAFAQVDNRLEQAFRPAMITRPSTQIMWLSTAGWKDGSPYLEAKVEAARAMVEVGTSSGLAYFEWSADEDADPDDEDEWARCMPALGHTITVEAIRAELRAMANNLPDFRRAYLNQWVRKFDPDSGVIDPEQWAALEDQASRISGPTALAVEIPPDRSTAAIVAVGRRSDGQAHVEVVEPGPERASGTWWVVDRLVELDRRHRPVAIVLDGSGPAGEIADALRARKVKSLVVLTTREMGQAAGAFVEAVEGGGVHHVGDPILSAGAVQGTKRAVGDLWVWKRRGSGVEVSTLIGATMALFALNASPQRRGSRSGVVV